MAIHIKCCSLFCGSLKCNKNKLSQRSRQLWYVLAKIYYVASSSMFPCLSFWRSSLSFSCLHGRSSHYSSSSYAATIFLSLHLSCFFLSSFPSSLLDSASSLPYLCRRSSHFSRPLLMLPPSYLVLCFPSYILFLPAPRPWHRGTDLAIQMQIGCGKGAFMDHQMGSEGVAAWLPPTRWR